MMGLRFQFAASTALLALVTLSSPTPVHAGGFEVPDQSPVAGGAGGASTARADDPSAAWYNPAALADGGGLRLGLGVLIATSSVHAESSATAPDGPWEADSESSVSLPPHIYLSFAKDDWAAGLSFNVPFGSRVYWPDDWQHRFDAIDSQTRFFRTAPFVAYRFGRLRIAAGLHVDAGILESFRATNHIVEEGSVHLRLGGVGVGGDAALFFEASDRFDIGVSYKSRTRIEMDGDVDFEVPEAFRPRFPDQQASTTLTLPDRLAIGIRARVTDDVTLLTDISLTFWSVNDRLLIDFSDELTNDADRAANWENSVALRVGAEFTPIPELTARVGFFFDGLTGAPPPQDFLSPTSPDSRRVGGSLGLSYDIGERFGVDAYYSYLKLLGEESTSLDAPLAEYDGSAHLIGIGLRVHYDPASSAAAPEEPVEPGEDEHSADDGLGDGTDMDFSEELLE